MSPPSTDYSKLLAELRAVRSLVDSYDSAEPHISSLNDLKHYLAEAIAQLETLSGLRKAIAEIQSAGNHEAMDANPVFGELLARGDSSLPPMQTRQKRTRQKRPGNPS